MALGIGRFAFAFTPLLPLMLHGGVSGPQLDIQHGGWLASFNYADYFVITVLLTLAMGVTNQF